MPQLAKALRRLSRRSGVADTGLVEEMSGLDFLSPKSSHSGQQLELNWRKSFAKTLEFIPFSHENNLQGGFDVTFSNRFLRHPPRCFAKLLRIAGDLRYCGHDGPDRFL